MGTEQSGVEGPSRRDVYLRRWYNVSEDEWESLLAEQGGGCYGCGGKGKTRALHTDHSHKTGIVRGILCASCNSALRKLKDNPDIAERLAEYLREPPAVALLGPRKARGRSRGGGKSHRRGTRKPKRAR